MDLLLTKVFFGFRVYTDRQSEVPEQRLLQKNKKNKTPQWKWSSLLLHLPHRTYRKRKTPKPAGHRSSGLWLVRFITENTRRRRFLFTPWLNFVALTVSGLTETMAQLFSSAFSQRPLFPGHLLDGRLHNHSKNNKTIFNGLLQRCPR